MKSIYHAYYYTDQELSDDPIEKEFASKKALFNYFMKHRNDADKFYMFISRRNEDNDIIEDYDENDVEMYFKKEAMKKASKEAEKETVKEVEEVIVIDVEENTNEIEVVEVVEANTNEIEVVEKVQDSKYTDLELQVIEQFWNFLNYDELKDNLQDNATAFEANEIEGINYKVLRGVLSSLVKKELIQYEDWCEMFYVTKKGLKEYYRIFRK